MQHFSALAKDHFLNPRNVGDVNEPAVTERAGSLKCGAAIRVSLQVDETQNIVDARFRAAGCVFLVASASFLTSLLKGKATGDAAAQAHLHETLVLEQLGEVPADRRHCVALAGETMIKAIQSYSDSIRERWLGDEALICTCFCISESTIENAIRQHKLRTIAEVTKACRAGAGCRSCYSLIEDILASQRQAFVD
jgi:NifU-like protein